LTHLHQEVSTWAPAGPGN